MWWLKGEHQRASRAIPGENTPLPVPAIPRGFGISSLLSVLRVVWGAEFPGE